MKRASWRSLALFRILLIAGAVIFFLPQSTPVFAAPTCCVCEEASSLLPEDAARCKGISAPFEYDSPSGDPFNCEVPCTLSGPADQVCMSQVNSKAGACPVKPLQAGANVCCHCQFNLPCNGKTISAAGQADCAVLCTNGEPNFSCASSVSDGACPGPAAGATTQGTPPVANTQFNVVAGSIPEIFGRIIKGIIGISGTVALAMMTYGGFLWLTSAGAPETITKARNIVVWAALGIFVLFAAYAILQTVFATFGGAAGLTIK